MDGGCKEIPITFAPSLTSQALNQEPLNPVWPVITTVFPLNTSNREFLLLSIATLLEYQFRGVQLKGGGVVAFWNYLVARFIQLSTYVEKLF